MFTLLIAIDNSTNYNLPISINNSGDLVKKSGAQLTQRQVTKYEVA